MFVELALPFGFFHELIQDIDDIFWDRMKANSVEHAYSITLINLLGYD